MTAVDLSIRPAAPEEGMRLAAFAERTFRETYTPISVPADVEAHIATHFSPAIQAAELADPARQTLFALVGDTLAGFAQLRRRPAPAGVPGARPIEISRFYVDAPWHGRGVARSLMESCVARAAAEADCVWLGVFQRNWRAVRFYEKSGFRIVATQTFTMGSEVQDDYVMARELRDGAPAPRA